MAAAADLEYQMMWGAKVRLPCDMQDDVLRDAIESVTAELAAVGSVPFLDQRLAR